MNPTDALFSTGGVLLQLALNFWPAIVFLFSWAIVVSFMGRGGRE